MLRLSKPLTSERRRKPLSGLEAGFALLMAVGCVIGLVWLLCGCNGHKGVTASFSADWRDAVKGSTDTVRGY